MSRLFLALGLAGAWGRERARMLRCSRVCASRRELVLPAAWLGGVLVTLQDLGS